MARFKTHDFYYRASDGTRHHYKIVININSDGWFTTTLPSDASFLLQGLGVSLQKNLQKNPGYYTSETVKGLLEAIQKDFDEAFSRELVEDIVVLKYWLNTRCSYGITSEGEIIPNIGHEWAKGEELKWAKGTQNTHAAAPDSYGFDIAVTVQNKKTFRYKSGKEIVEYDHVVRMSDELKEIYKEDYFFRYISGLTSMAFPKPYHNLPPVREAPYDPDLAALLVGMIKSVVKLNERIKDIISNEDKLLEVAKNSGMSLLQ